MQVIQASSPHSVCFSANPVNWLFFITPYTEAERSANIKLSVTVEAEDITQGGVYVSVKQSVYNPAEDGSVQVNIQRLANAMLTQYIPKPGLAKPVTCNGQQRGFRIVYSLISNDVLIGSTVEATPVTVIKGGLPLEEWHPYKFFTEYLTGNKPFLRYGYANEKAGAEEPKFLTWLYLGKNRPGFATPQYVKATIFLDNGDTVPVDVGSILTAKNTLITTPAGFNQLGMPALVPAGRIALRWQVYVTDNLGAVIINPTAFVLDYRNFYDPRYLLFNNSLGSIETLRLRGDKEFETDLQRQTADITYQPNYVNNNFVVATAKNFAALETEMFRADTGFMPQDGIDRLRDLFLATECLYEAKANRLVPIVMNGGSVKLYTSRDKLFSQELQFKNAFSNEKYAPDDLLQGPETCPLPSFAMCLQAAKYFLTVIWKLAPGYDRADISIQTSSTATEVIRIEGNAGTRRIYFDNPMISPGSSIVFAVRIRTVCNDASVVESASAYMDITPTIVGSYAPVLADDRYYVPYGLTAFTQLAGSVLDNDYDPDNDPLTVTPVTNAATVKGGNVTITAAGKVSYKPPTAGYIGEDSYVYTATDGTTPQTATIYFTVGTPVVATTVYVKKSLRNIVVHQLPNGGEYSTAEVWATWYSDAAGTIPVNVSGLGLVLNYKMEKYVANAISTTTNYTKPGVGADMQLFSGIVSKQDSFAGNLVTTEYRYTLMPGTGYTVI